MAALDCPTGSASSRMPDTMIYRCIVCTGRICPCDLHLIRGPVQNKHLHHGCLPEYFDKFEEINEREDRKRNRAYWRDIYRKEHKFMTMKRKLKPKLHRFSKSLCRSSGSYVETLMSWTAVWSVDECQLQPPCFLYRTSFCIHRIHFLSKWPVDHPISIINRRRYILIYTYIDTYAYTFI